MAVEEGLVRRREQWGGRFHLEMVNWGGDLEGGDGGLEFSG